MTLQGDVSAGPAPLLPAVEDFLAGPRHLIIGGESRPSADGATFTTVDPATGGPLATVAEAGPEDIDAAVAAARTAFDGAWSTVSPADRSRLINRLADALEERADEFAQLESLDVGKPLALARARDINLVINQYRYFAGWPTKIDGRVLATSIPNTFAYTRREPLGVVGAIVPWNFPLNLASWKIAPALAAGCTVVLKPAEQTPLTALRLGELALEVGFPPGVLNVCPGFGATAGAALARHPGIDAIAFTGSVSVGREVGRSAVENLTHSSLELGGKSPSIVLADASPAEAAMKTAGGIFFNSGQVCSAPSRLMVQDSLYDEVLDGVVRYAEGLRMGPGLDPATTMGPLVSAEQLERVTSFIERGAEEGGELATGGLPKAPDSTTGFFCPPTVIEQVRDDDTLAREEIFGPVLIVQRFSDVEEAVRRANASRYGLAAGVFTNDIRQSHRVAAALKVGTVWVNCWGFLDPHVPFGGYKDSGFGRDNGPEALEKFLQVKSVWTTLE